MQEVGIPFNLIKLSLIVLPFLATYSNMSRYVFS